MPKKTSRSLLALAVASALTASTVSPASALTDSDALAPGGSVDEVMRDLIIGSSQNPGSSGLLLDATLGSLDLVGSSEVPLSGPLLSSDARYPLDTDPSIRTAQIVDRQTEPDHYQVATGEDRVQRWTVASPSMQRNVSVEVMLAPDPERAAPILYLLDGIDAPRRSGWIGIGGAQEVLGQENVHVVIPTEAPGSWYSDWDSEDPALGLNRWETFITTELDPLLTEELNASERRGIGGLSMGASGAVHLANTNPDLFDAVFGISGCYSPVSPMGRQIVNIVTGSRGGDVENMWGPFGSQQWEEHDIVADPRGLRDMAVYLSAADGTLNEEDTARYEGQSFFNLAAGTFLERGVLTCTEELDQSMQDRGMDHHLVDYKGEGVHNWANFNDQLAPAWEHIRPALQETDPSSEVADSLYTRP